jgi:hypothetical protein
MLRHSMRTPGSPSDAPRLLRKPVQQIEAYRARKEHGQNMDQG